MTGAADLRGALPYYQTPELIAEGERADQLVREMGLDIPCAMGASSRRLLYQVVRAMGATSVLDIGTYCGTSAAIFAQAVGPAGRVVTVDIRDANRDGAYWSRVPGGRPPREVLAAAGLADRVTFVHARSEDFLARTTERFDFISIDGWHESFAVYTEILLALERLKPNGLIFMDDVQRPGFQVPQGTDKIKGPFRALEWHQQRGTPIRAHFNEESPTAFLLRTE